MKCDFQHEYCLYTSVVTVCWVCAGAFDLEFEMLIGCRVPALLPLHAAHICRHFNYHGELRPFFHFGQLGFNQTHYITSLLAAKASSAL